MVPRACLVAVSREGRGRCPLLAFGQFTPEVFLNQRSQECCAPGFSSSKILPPEASEDANSAEAGRERRCAR